MRALLLLLVLFTSLLVTAQDTVKTKQSRFEEFSSEDGVLKKYESHKFGKLKGYIMTKRTVTNVETEKYYNAVEVSEKFNLWTGKGGGTILFDEDEIPSIIKTLKYFLNNVIKDDCKEECPSYIYETRGGIYLYCNKTIGAYASSWHVYVSRRLYLIAGSIDLDTKDLETFTNLLETYKGISL
ncbi:MAG: hypothetical protein IPP31_10425 [Chitinophagaceae bacterium]|nr:hypothetical protein [Chitinophagaceae bacterium]